VHTVKEGSAQMRSFLFCLLSCFNAALEGRRSNHKVVLI
jgi:hypothetical protein